MKEKQVTFNIDFKLIALVIGITFLFQSFSYSSVTFDLEGGGLFSGYNDVSIPGDSGTRFSLTEDLSTSPYLYYRIKTGYSFLDRHNIVLLLAPLKIKADGTLNKSIRFMDKTFPANSPLNAEYKFNSYRLSYRYDFIQSEGWDVGVGITGKVRDAYISISDGNSVRKYTDLGFVPLINFRIHKMLNNSFSLLFEGDALISPYGRAEDVLFAFQYHLNRSLLFKTGYRILEGGADNDKVYTFALFHYIVAGVGIEF